MTLMDDKSHSNILQEEIGHSNLNINQKLTYLCSFLLNLPKTALFKKQFMPITCQNSFLARKFLSKS